MSIVVPTHQVPMLPTVDLKLVSSPSPEHTVMNIAPQNAGHSPVIGAVTNLSPSAGISAPNKFPVAVGQKRKIEKLMQFPHDDLECNLTTEDLVAIAKTAVTLPPLPEPEHEFLTSIKVTPSPCRPIAKKLCLERNNVNICPQPVLQTNLQPFQNNPLQPRMMAPPKFRYPSLPEPILSSVMLPKPMSLTPGVMRITPRNSFTHIPPVGVIARTNKVTNATSAKRRGRNPASKPQMRYDPEVPMTKQEAAAWRREQRRVRNRESAALSRQKTRDRISELEMELKGWQKKYGDAMERVQTLEQQRQPRPSLSDAGGPTLILNSRPSQSNHQSSMISPTSSPSSSPVPFNNVVPQVVPSLSRVPPAAELSVSSCLIPLVLDSRVTHNSSSPPLQLLPQIYRSQVHNTDGAQNLVIAPQPQLVPISKTHQLMEQQLQRQKPEGQHFNETNLRPAVKIDSAVPKVEAHVTAATFIDVSEWNVNKVSKGINAIKILPLVVVPDSCCSNTVIGTVVKSSNATAAAVSDNSDDDTAAASVSKDVEEDDTTSSTASAINLLDDGGNVLDDILFDALKGIDGFYENSSCAL